MPQKRNAQDQYATNKTIESFLINMQKQLMKY